MADRFLDNERVALRLVWVFKVTINLAFGVLSFLTPDVQPAVLCGVLFLAAAALNGYVAAKVRVTRAVSTALALSVMACLFRAMALTFSWATGRLPHVNAAHFAVGITIWLGFAFTAIIMTLGAARHLGDECVRRP